MIKKLSKRDKYLGAGILCLLLIFVFTTQLKSESPGLSDISPSSKTEFWQTQASLAEKGLAQDSTDMNYYFQLAMSQAMLGQIDESMSSFQTLAKLDPDNTYAQQVLELYGDNKTYQDNLLIQSYLAFAYYVQENFSASVEAFERVIQLDPSNAWPLNYQGFSLYKCNRLDEAVTALEKSVRLDPSNQYSRALLGMAYYEQGHIFKALAELARAPKIIGKYFK